MMDQKAFLLALVLTLASLVVLGIALWLEPDGRGFGTHTQLGLEPCAYFVRTGQPCMSCGMTTAFTNMAHLRPIAAWRANPMGLVLFLVTAATPIYLIRCMRLRRHPFHVFDTRWGRWLPALLVAMILATWILRHGLPRGF